MTDWIKVEDKLPLEGQAVFYYFVTCGVFAGYYAVDKNMFWSNRSGWLIGDVTHWMPRNPRMKMPEAPLT